MTRIIWLTSVILPLIVSYSLAQDDENEKRAPSFRTVPWAVWGGVGTNFDSYSLSIALRRGPWGLGLGYRHNTKSVPDYSTETPPSTVGGETSLTINTVGMDIYTKTAIADFVDGYGLIGGYVDVNTLIVQDAVTKRNYLSPNSPDWTNVQIAYGAGLEFNPISWLIAGIGYHSVRGFGIHAGITW